MSAPENPSETEVVRGLAAVPAGRWAVGVSGGADSVTLLVMLRDRPDVAPHAVHLDHQSRGEASAADARFVADLAGTLGIPCTIAKRDDVEAGLPTMPTNPSARYRAARLALFRRVVREHSLAGVILAHHAGDQAETVLQRLLRGSGPAGMAGMSPRSVIGGLLILRPLLDTRPEALRAVLAGRGQGWREDESNASPAYLRNRLRCVLSRHPGLTHALIQLGDACRDVRDWLHTQVPAGVKPTVHAAEMLALPAPVRREFARRWLAVAGVPAARIEPPVIDRLLRMADDVATPARQDFPGGVIVRRKAGVLSWQHTPREL